MDLFTKILKDKNTVTNEKEVREENHRRIIEHLNQLPDRLKSLTTKQIFKAGKDSKPYSIGDQLVIVIPRRVTIKGLEDVATPLCRVRRIHRHYPVYTVSFINSEGHVFATLNDVEEGYQSIRRVDDQWRIANSYTAYLVDDYIVNQLIAYNMKDAMAVAQELKDLYGLDQWFMNAAYRAIIGVRGKVLKAHQNCEAP